MRSTNLYMCVRMKCLKCESWYAQERAAAAQECEAEQAVLAAQLEELQGQLQSAGARQVTTGEYRAVVGKSAPRLSVIARTRTYSERSSTARILAFLTQCAR